MNKQEDSQKNLVTTNWLSNCEVRNYRVCGYREHIIKEIKISGNFRIEISDYTQPSSNGFGQEAFFTSVTFFMKELDNHSIYAPSIYDRPYSIYYPYGTRFNELWLKLIGLLLNKLINNARDLDDTVENQKQLKKIYNYQKQLLQLLINQIYDTKIILKIMIDMKDISFIDYTREAYLAKDWLPRNLDSRQKTLKK